MTAAAIKPIFLTSIGKKYIMAASGIIWAGFVMGHMLGNLLILLGADAYNKYGHAITSGGFIFVVEAVLIVSLVAHVVTAIALTVENHRARGEQKYLMTPNRDKGARKTSQHMIYHGTIILIFLVLHLITFKFGTEYSTTVDGVQMRDLHRLLVEVFHQPGYLFWYFICLALLGVHLKHGVRSFFQSTGLLGEKYSALIEKISLVYSLVVAVGFIIQPVYVYFLLPEAS